MYKAGDGYRPRAAQVECLAKTMFFEARSDGELGMTDVAYNVLKRVDIKYRGAVTVCDVTGFPHQYSWMWDNVPDVVLSEEMHTMFKAYRIAESLVLLYGVNELPFHQIGECEGGSTHYHHKDIYPFWATNMDKVCGLSGSHVHYIGK